LPNKNNSITHCDYCISSNRDYLNTNCLKQSNRYYQLPFTNYLSMGKINSICSDFIDLLFVGWEGMPRNFFNQDGSKDRKINREAHLNNII